MKTGKNLTCFGVRPSKIGDQIFASPALNFLELAYPNSYKIFAISKCCSQAAPIWINHPLIDKIHVLELNEALGPNDKKLYDDADVKFDLFPNHPDGIPNTGGQSCWWNYFNVYEESWRMCGLWIDDYHKLPKDEQIPRLSKWFKINNYPKVIALWGWAGYGVENQRNPSLEWYNNLIEAIEDNTNLEIWQFGAENEPHLKGGCQWGEKIKRFNHLPFFEQIRLSLGTGLAINSDSGSGVCLAAYGHKQINLLIRNAPNHFQNFLAFQPLNCDNNGISLVGLDGPDSIKHEDVLAAIEKLK